MALVAAFVAGIFLSGYYPALALLNRKPITLLKGKFLNSTSGKRTRKVLVVMQYTASIGLALRYTDRIRTTQLHAQPIAGGKDRTNPCHQIPRTDGRDEHQAGSLEEIHCPATARTTK